MKKTLAVLLAAIMLLASLAVCFAVFANEGGAEVSSEICDKCHKKHTSMEKGKCTCCLNCEYLDMDKVAECSKDAYGVKKSCCDQCTGFYNCTCGKRDDCNCYACQGKGDEPQPDLQPVIDEQSQLHIKDIVQSILKKISEVFDRMFEVAFAIFNIK